MPIRSTEWTGWTLRRKRMVIVVSYSLIGGNNKPKQAMTIMATCGAQSAPPPSRPSSLELQTTSVSPLVNQRKDE